MTGFEAGIMHDSTGAEKLGIARPDGRPDDSKEPIKEVLLAGNLSAFWPARGGLASPQAQAASYVEDGESVPIRCTSVPK
jgi:hypothetical protein